MSEIETKRARRVRTDVHAPKNLVTSDYEFVGCGCYGTAEIDAFSPLTTPYGQRILAEGWRFGGEGGGNCDHCGAFIIYYAVLKHEPSHTLIKVGETCLDNRFALATGEFQTLRKAAKLHRERNTKRERWTAWLAEGDNAAIVEWVTAERQRETAEWQTAQNWKSSRNYGEPGFYSSCIDRIERTEPLSDPQRERIAQPMPKVGNVPPPERAYAPVYGAPKHGRTTRTAAPKHTPARDEFGAPIRRYPKKEMK